MLIENPDWGQNADFRERPIEIGICDDEVKDRQDIMAALADYEGTRPLHVRTYTSGDELLEDTKPLDILFLDILMEGVNGMEAARSIRRRQQKTLIVLVTATPDFVYAGYEVDAFRYLLKPFQQSDILTILNLCCSRLNDGRLTVRSGAALYHIPFEDIQSIEAQARSSLIRIADEIISVPLGISKLEEQLPPGMFFRCHKSFIINLMKVRRLKRYEAVLEDRSTVPVSRALWQQLRAKMMSFLST